ncbi:MAG: anti-sigma F factor [Oscillospiraceae bacterium]
MTVYNEIKVTFPSKSCNEAMARMTAAAAAAQLDPSAAELIDIKTAVSEAVTNCIVHAYRDRIGKIEMTCRILDDSVLYIRIKDKGCGIADVKQAMEPLFTTAPQEERAGLGFAVMESFMDSVKVSSAVGKGTTVTMTKKITERALYVTRSSANAEAPSLSTAGSMADGEADDEKYT